MSQRLFSAGLMMLGFLVATATGARLGAQESEAADPVLRPGDVVQIRVWRKPELSGDFTIAPNGAIADPFYATVMLGGLTVSAANERVRSHIAAIEAEPRVWVEPLFRVAVTGQVRQPSLYPVARGTTVGQALAQAGGAADLGDLRRVLLVRDGASTTIDLTAPANPQARTVVRSGDEIIVPRRSNFLRDVLVPLSSVGSLVGVIAVLIR